MLLHWSSNPATQLFVTLLLVLLFAIACGAAATATPVPRAAPAPLEAPQAPVAAAPVTPITAVKKPPYKGGRLACSQFAAYISEFWQPQPTDPELLEAMTAVAQHAANAEPEIGNAITGVLNSMATINRWLAQPRTRQEILEAFMEGSSTKEARDAAAVADVPYFDFFRYLKDMPAACARYGYPT